MLSLYQFCELFGQLAVATQDIAARQQISTSARGCRASAARLAVMVVAAGSDYHR